MPIMIVVSALVTELLLYYFGRTSPQHLLMVLFGLWVLVPYAVYLAGLRIGAGWPAAVRVQYTQTVGVIVTMSMAAYAYGAFGPPLRPHAVLWIAFPAVVDLFVGCAVVLAIIQARKEQ